MTSLYFTLAVFAGLFVYAWLGHRISVQGGKVPSQRFGLPDLFMVTVFFWWFSLLFITHLEREAPRVIHTRDVLQSGYLALSLLFLVCGFLKCRHISLVELFGLRRVTLWKIPGVAFLLLLAAYPLIGLATAVSQKVLGGKNDPQEIVQFFLEASKKPDHWPMVITALMGVIIAPLVEEIIFRGYIYPTVKRYLGLSAGVVLNAALFAAIHLNKPSLFPLFVLAVCFTLVYEATGSLLVSMTMHSLFNLATFLALVVVSHTHA